MVTERRAHTTRREIRAFFLDRGLYPRRGLGQNFLVDPNLLRVVAEAGGGEDDVVLEIGAGTGSLTEELSRRCARVIGVEIDPELFDEARDALSSCSNVRLLLGDILKEGSAVADSVREAVAQALADDPRLGFKVVGDLPYSVATPTIQALLEMEPLPDAITVTVQWEVAERMMAAAGTRAYGYLTVLVQSRAHVELLRELPPHVYWPRPKVRSALVRIVPDEGLYAPRPAADALKRVAGALFTQRRKTAANALLNAGMAPDRAAANRLLAGAGIEPGRRADAVAVAEIAALARPRAEQHAPRDEEDQG